MFPSPRPRTTSTERVTRLSLTIAIALSLPIWALSRPGLAARGVSNPSPPAPPVVGLVTHDLATGGETPASLVQALVGAGAVVSNIQYSGAPIAAGTFAGGGGIIGFERGVILGSGDIALVVGPVNTREDATADNGTPGDADLEAVQSPVRTTYDASVLEFDLECPAGNMISFQFVFTSEEYDNTVAGSQSDVFACFLNGQNIALIPGTNSPISIHGVNCGYPYHPPSGMNCEYYITNDCYSLGFGGYPCTNIATEMNGLTTVISAAGRLQPGSNHIKLAIADLVDTGYDSNVFIRGQSFDCSSTPPVFDSPSPCAQILTATVGVPFSFGVAASATNGLPGESVTLDVTGDAIPLAGGTFVPPLPAGPAQPVTSQFQWTPTLADIGQYHLDFTVTDQLLQSAACDVTIRVLPSPGADLCQAGVGAVMACPCSNPPATAPGGCDNSSGTGGARLSSVGGPSLGDDSVVFTAVGESPAALSIVVQGDVLLSSGVIYGQGVRCVGGLLKRMYVKTASGGSITAPQSGDPSVSLRSAARGDPISPGTSRYYSVYYRDPTILGGCPADATFNVTQTQQVLWGP